jgi:hypothetical protein
MSSPTGIEGEENMEELNALLHTIAAHLAQLPPEEAAKLYKEIEYLLKGDQENDEGNRN